MEREGEDISRDNLLYKLVIDPLHEREQVCSWLWETLSLKEPILAKAKRSFHLSGRYVEMCCYRQGIISTQRWVHFLLIDRCEKSYELFLIDRWSIFRDRKGSLSLRISFDLDDDPK